MIIFTTMLNLIMKQKIIRAKTRAATVIISLSLSATIFMALRQRLQITIWSSSTAEWVKLKLRLYMRESRHYLTQPRSYRAWRTHLLAMGLSWTKSSQKLPLRRLSRKMRWFQLWNFLMSSTPSSKSPPLFAINSQVTKAKWHTAIDHQKVRKTSRLKM